MSLIWRSEFPSAWWLMGMTVLWLVLFGIIYRLDAVIDARWNLGLVYVLGILGAILGLAVVLIVFSIFGLF